MKGHLLMTSAALALAMSLAAPVAVVAQDESTTGAVTAPVNAIDAAAGIQGSGGPVVRAVHSLAIVKQQRKGRWT